MIDIVHGDIKPENVLIFKDDHGNFFPKLADFGFSTLSTQEDELVRLPRSRPWDAPEWHHRGFRFPAARKMDAYSLGVLCLWLVFNETFGQNTTSSASSSNGQTGYAYLKTSWKEYPRHTLLEKLKYEDELPALACYLISTAIEGNDDQKCKLESFFALTLAREPEERSSDFGRLITLLGRDR
jgi:serine/threonine protein kinase